MAPDLSFSARQIVRIRAREFVTRQIAEETLIVPVAGGVGDLDAIYTLNPVAARIWKILESPVSVDRIADEISLDFDVSREEATRDVVQFLETLESAGLIQPAGGSGSEP
ncbi:MAG: PqqD family protein [Vicinamibacterales bacterium]